MRTLDSMAHPDSLVALCGTYEARMLYVQCKEEKDSSKAKTTEVGGGALIPKDPHCKRASHSSWLSILDLLP